MGFKAHTVLLLLIAAAICWKCSANEDDSARVTLTSTLVNEHRAYRQQEINFTCTIKTRSATTNLTWRSDEYIGQGRQNVLQFSLNDSLGTSISSPISEEVFATLTNVTTLSNGERVITSQLRIVALSMNFSEYPNHMHFVRCQVNRLGPMITARFRVVPPKVMLTSNLINDNLAYDGEIVIFICVMTSAETITSWNSDVYIGIGGQSLQLTANDSPGFNQTSGETVATLIDATTHNGVTVITSQLQIKARRHPKHQSVICRVNSHGRVNVAMFRVVPVPKVILTSTLINGSQVYDGDIVIFTCVITSEESILYISWNSNEYVGHSLHVAVGDGPKTNGETVATLISATSNNGVTVIVSQLQIVASSNFSNPQSVSCQVNSHGPINTTNFFVVDSTMIPPNGMSTIYSGTEPITMDFGAVIIVPSVLLTVVILICIFTIIVLGALLKRYGRC